MSAISLVSCPRSNRRRRVVTASTGEKTDGGRRRRGGDRVRSCLSRAGLTDESSADEWSGGEWVVRGDSARTFSRTFLARRTSCSSAFFERTKQLRCTYTLKFGLPVSCLSQTHQECFMYTSLTEKIPWPSGLRRQIKVLVRKGAGSNPAGVNFYFYSPCFIHPPAKLNIPEVYSVPSVCRSRGAPTTY